jgi:glycosyltransferase involved in cell wall biosynthesis
VSKTCPTVLQIIPKLDSGGAERTVVEMSDAIVRAGGRALVLAETGRLAEDVKAVGGVIIDFPAATKNPFKIWSNSRAIARIVATEGVDLIHARSRAPAWSARLACRRLKLPFVTTYHGAYNETGSLKRAYNSVMAQSDVVIANSKYTANLIASRYDTPRDKIRVIYRGIDPVRFDAMRVEPERISSLRQAWGVAPNARVILQAARLTGWKGQLVLIEAAGLLHKQGRLREAVVVLAGEAQGRDGYVVQLKQRVTALGLDGRVVLVGHVDDVPAAYMTAHVTVVASIEPEAFGRSAAEAEAMGCPVIATNIGAPPETVRAAPAFAETEITGWLVKPSDPVELAEKLAVALELPELERGRMGARARRFVLDTFSLDALKVQTLAVYDQCLGTDLAQRFEVANRARIS